MRDGVALLVPVLLGLALAGCARTPAETAPDDAAPVTPASTESPPLAAPGTTLPGSVPIPPLILTGCEDLQASVPAPADDFAGLPSGWNVVLDEFGFATLAFVHQTCHIPGSPVPPKDTVFVFFLLEPPAPLRLAGGTHGGLVMAWSSDAEAVASLHEWGIASAELHDLGISNSDSHGDTQARVVQGDPDFVLTLDTAGSSAALPWASLRFFEFDGATPVAAFDRYRDEVLGSNGLATASLLLDTRPGDFPDHRVGTGSVMTSADVDVTLAPFAFAA